MTDHCNDHSLSNPKGACWKDSGSYCDCHCQGCQPPEEVLV